MSTGFRRIALGALFSILAGLPAYADGAVQRTLSVSGQGEVKAAPDQSNLSAGVTTQASSAAQALAANTRAMNAVFATLKRLGIADKDIQTSDFSVSPQYQTYKPGTSGPQRIVGYQVSNTVNVTVEDIAKTGAVLDALVASGSNQIGDIGFSIRDPKPLLRAAREAAVADAVDRAQSYAAAAGAKLGAILSIQEGGGAYQPRPMLKAMALAAAVTPLAGGEQSVSVEVSITWAIQ